MFTLAQLSDLHLASLPVPHVGALLSKRGLGLINWYRSRRKHHRPDVLAAVVRDLKGRTTDHIAVTGDLVNLSLPAEYARARGWLETLGASGDVTVIPGNHDIYVRGTEAAPAAAWGDFMRGDDGGGGFPFLRRRGKVALIALSTALPTAPLLATGRLGETQLARFAELLDQTRGAFRIVLIHHPPVTSMRHYLRRLTDAAALLAVLEAKGCELLLHGHEHTSSLIWLDGADHRIPAVGVASASTPAPHGDEDAGGYNLYHVDGGPGAWRCEMILRRREADGGIRERERRTLY